jgi:hypothetical protein
MDDLLQPTETPTRYVPRHIKHEESIQRQVCSYLRMQYPQVLFRSDYASGLHLTINQARTHRALQSGRAWPDLFIYHPTTVQGKDGPRKFYGCALELKRDGTTIIVSRGARKGHLTSDPHIQEQFLMLKELARLGYYANFAVGFDEAQQIIDWYMGKPHAETEAMF